MTPIATADFLNNLLILLDETFAGPPDDRGSAYLDKGAGLFQTLANLDAAVASGTPFPGAATVASHLHHVDYYMRALREFMVGGNPKPDWKASWAVETVNAEAWSSLRAQALDSYRALKETILATESWDDDAIGYSLAVVVHSAYHLGAIRQLVKASTAG